MIALESNSRLSGPYRRARSEETSFMLRQLTAITLMLIAALLIPSRLDASVTSFAVVRYESAQSHIASQSQTQDTRSNPPGDFSSDVAVALYLKSLPDIEQRDLQKREKEINVLKSLVEKYRPVFERASNETGFDQKVATADLSAMAQESDSQRHAMLQQAFMEKYAAGMDGISRRAG